MPYATAHRLPDLDDAARFTSRQVIGMAQEVVVELEHQVSSLRHQLDACKHQIEWFKRQLFGQKSERRLPDVPPEQMSLGELFAPAPETAAPPPAKPVAAHHRRAGREKPADGDALPFFDRDRVPVEVIDVANPDMAGLTPDQYEVICYKDSYRLAQRPGSYVVLHYRRPVIKRRDTQAISCPPAPAGVIDGSRADVSFIAGILVDKLAWHQPFYRQHQKLLAAGFRVSRPWLTQVAQQGIALLEPIYEALLASINTSRVRAMDETTIKAGLDQPGKMKAAYYWPVYGEHDEIAFHFFESRRHEHVDQALGLTPAEDAVLLSDGYGAYSSYAARTGITHAQCWAHARRLFFEAKEAEPVACAQALDMIAALYAAEAHVREHKLTGSQKRDFRLAQARPVVERFFIWIDQQFARHGLLPKNPLTKALAYARERRSGLEVYLADPDVPIDTNHLERALRAIPMGRKAWLFCWTELGARQIGIVQSLITTCRLHQVDPYDYLVDVLQRVGQHPAKEVAQLTPRLWKQHFARHPLRSDVSHTITPGERTDT